MKPPMVRREFKVITIILLFYFFLFLCRENSLAVIHAALGIGIERKLEGFWDYFFLPFDFLLGLPGLEMLARPLVNAIASAIPPFFNVFSLAEYIYFLLVQFLW